MFHGRRHPQELGAADVTAFVTWLAVEQGVAGSTQNQALSGALFLYREVPRLPIGEVHVPPRATPRLLGTGSSVFRVDAV